MSGGYVGYITPEIALDPELHLYAGGLGYLAGSHVRSAYGMQKRLVCFSLLFRYGYYVQRIVAENDDHGKKILRMQVDYMPHHYEGVLEHTGVRIQIPLCLNPAVKADVLRLPAGRFNNADTYLLDADISENDDLSRMNSLYLYGGYTTGSSMERAIAQSMLLGRGSVEAARLLCIPIHCFHLNESYAAFAGVHLLEGYMRLGKTFDQALELTRARMVFTTHTPVPAGNPEYPLDKVDFMWGRYPERIISLNDLRRIGGDPFNMTAACIRLSRVTNAVSKRHLEVARGMWHGVVRSDEEMISVTNGVNREYWQLPEYHAVANWTEAESAKLVRKRAMLHAIAEEYNRHLSEHVLTLVWARRFAEYKRPKLLFYDLTWISQLLHSNRLQVIIAGKPHPDDLQMIDVWNYLLRLSYELPNLVVIPEYDLRISKLLKAGADVWLNTPRAPMEACGTSGQGAALNCTLNISTPDGWMCEVNVDNCFLFGTRYQLLDQDVYDLEALKNIMEGVMEFYCNDKAGWYTKTLAAKHEAEEYWTSDRMLREYEELYMTE